ncbi:MAG: hypothetical protein NTY75_03495 [Candidatus Shapirobacteria bacterium]|nr:hypothetical protein [Candidatus Shapirobacteria bacterium]
MAEVEKRFSGADGYNGKPIVLFPITEMEKAAFRAAIEMVYLPIKLTEELVKEIKARADRRRRP